MEENIVKILWTGGFDSTYRLVQLSRENVNIQPYYIVNEHRESLNEERKAMKEIYNILKEKPERQAKLLPIIELKRSDYPIELETHNSYKEVYQKAKLGPQYEWLSQVSKNVSDIEISLEKSANNPTRYDLYLREAKFEVNYPENKIRAYYVLTKDNDPALYNLLGNFRFPISIFTRSKMDFLADFEKWDCMDIAKKTWFCSMPIKGEPCGYCAPCRNVVKQGLEFRMPISSMKRYNNRLFWLVRYKIIKTWKQILGTWN